MEDLRMLLSGGCGEITEKKSRFIATIVPIDTEEEALSFIEQIKKKYWDAVHNCSAYVIGDKNELKRCSDDGEPSKTAGMPMLDIIISEGLHNVAAVVTRYFGGTLLGSGGLIRAYQEAVKEGLRHCTIGYKKFAAIYSVMIDYSILEKLKYQLEQMELHNLDTIYADTVTIQILVSLGKEETFLKKVQEISGGKADIRKEKDTAYAECEGKILLI